MNAAAAADDDDDGNDDDERGLTRGGSPASDTGKTNVHTPNSSFNFISPPLPPPKKKKKDKHRERERGGVTRFVSTNKSKTKCIHTYIHMFIPPAHSSAIDTEEEGQSPGIEPPTERALLWTYTHIYMYIYIRILRPRLFPPRTPHFPVLSKSHSSLVVNLISLYMHSFYCYCLCFVFLDV